MFTSPDTTTALSAPRYIANQPIQTSSSILTLATHRPSMLLLSKAKFAALLVFAHHPNKLKKEIEFTLNVFEDNGRDKKTSPTGQRCVY